MAWTTKKRRKQSNPVRYGHHQQPPFDSFLGEEGEDDILSMDENISGSGDEETPADGRVANMRDMDGVIDENADDVIDEVKSHRSENRSLNEAAINYSQFEHKYQYFCPHCSCPFASEEALKSHVEVEHVQKILERQLLHHHQQQQFQGTKTANGFEAVGPCGDETGSPAIDSQRLPRRSFSRDSVESGDSSNSSLNSPSLNAGQKSFDSNLPQNTSDQQTAKEFASILPFQLPNVPPLIPLTQSGGGSSSVVTSDGKVSLSIYSNPIAPFLFPILPHSAAQSGGQSNAAASAVPNGGSNCANPGGLRIFNPEAYCELCNKEFCNKYFLKTHKANKHGIYSMDTVVSTAGTFPTTATAAAAAAAAFFPAGLTSNSAAAAIQMQHILQQANSGGSGNASDAAQAAAAALAARSAAVINLESYCEICQKEFCNKYFLKKHKQKIHGMPMDGQSSQTGQSSQLQSSSASPASSVGGDQSSQKPNSPRSSPVTCSVITSPVNATSTTSAVLYSTEKQNTERENVCDICKQEFANIVILQTHKLTVHGATSIQGLNAQLQTMAESLAGVVGRPIMVPSSMGEGGNMVFTPEKLREMGVINADAFCEICCKEFCNKYFLRTHKLNKHGIGMDTNSSCGSSKSQQQTDKHQNDEGIRDCNDDSGLEPGQRDPNAHHLYGSDLSMFAHCELVCEVCSRPFASNYLLRMHKFYSHNIPYVKEEEFQKSLAASPVNEPGETTRAEGDHHHRSVSVDASGADPTSDQASQDLQKLQSMIKELNATAYLEKATCSLCRQECDNKYYLRVHMINDHGVTPTDEGALESGNLMRSMFDSAKIAFPSFNAMSGSSGGSADSEAFCELCQKEFCSKYFLKTHRQNIHGIIDGSTTPTSTPTSTQMVQQSPQQSLAPLAPQVPHKKSEEVVSSSNKMSPKPLVSPTKSVSTTIGADGKPRMITGRNYCNICNKELCNKYFMKTHMLKMHGINIDEHPAEAAVTSTIGGVTCDICQKELCSKYFLKVHKQNTHGIFEEPPQPKEPRGELCGTGERDNTAAQGIDPSDTSNRYFSHYTEVCPLCERRFKSIKWLKTHMINDHSDLVAVRQADIAASGSSELTRMCVLCGQTFNDRIALQIHLAKDHRTTAEELGIGCGSNSNSGMKAIIPVTTATDLSLSSIASYNQLQQHQQHQHHHQQQQLQHQQLHHHQQQQQLHRQENRSPGEVQQVESQTSSSSLMNGTSSPINHGSPEDDVLKSPSSLNSLNESGAKPIACSTATSTSTTASASLTTSSSAVASFSLKRTISGTRIYQCSYCNYSTRWLSNLYAHEKRHTRMNTEGDKKFVCRICHRAYRYNHSLQRHLHNHRAAGLNTRDMNAMSFFGSASSASNHKSLSSLTASSLQANDGTFVAGSRHSLPVSSHLSSTQSEGPVKVKRYRCSKCNKKFRTRDLCLAHIHMYHSDSRKIVVSSAGCKSYISNKQVFRCVTCGFATRHYNLLKTHINKQHNKGSYQASKLMQENVNSPLNLRKSPDSSNADEALSLVVKDRAKDSLKLQLPVNASRLPLQPQELPQLSPPCQQLPMAYPMPQSPPSAGSFIMQPFLIAPPESDVSLKNDTFVPSLVYLPVSQKVLQPLTVAFQLTPA